MEEVPAEDGQQNKAQRRHGENNLPSRRIMVIFLLGPHSQRCDAIGRAVGCPDETRCDGFLGVTSRVGCHQCEDHDHGGGENRRQVEAPEGCHLGAPVGFPYHDGACNDWETAYHAEYGAAVRDVDCSCATQEEGHKECGASSSKEENSLQGRILNIHESANVSSDNTASMSRAYAKGLNDDRSKASRGAVGQAESKDHDHVEIRLGVGKSLANLLALDRLVFDSDLLVP